MLGIWSGKLLPLPKKLMAAEPWPRSAGAQQAVCEHLFAGGEAKRGRENLEHQGVAMSKPAERVVRRAGA